MDDLETTATLAFHGVEYVVTVGVQRQVLQLQVEIDTPGTPSGIGIAAGPPNAAASLPEACCWTAQFPASYIEDLTRKTGNFKRFPVFVNMLLSALARRSDAVFVDLLTTADLELYRKRKMGRAQATTPVREASDNTSADISSKQTKRYLILTYAVEFDRVHYPLPLNLVQTPTPEILQCTIRRLRHALATATQRNGTVQVEEDLAALREENRCLKNTLQHYCDEQGEAAVPRAGSTLDLERELEASMDENKELIRIYQQLREDSSAEIADLRAEIKQLRLRQQEGTSTQDRTLAKERQDLQARLQESSAATREALLQLKHMKTQLEESQLKNKELLRQLAIARAKAGRMVNPPSSRFASPDAPDNRFARTGRRRKGDDLDWRTAQRTDDITIANNGNGIASSTPRPRRPRRPFHRFDPTAYQREKELKQQERAAHSRSPSPASRSSRSTPRQQYGGYSSDSSAGGYSSAGSRSDATTSSRASARPRGRSRVVSAQRQREVDARLASPKRLPPPAPPLSKPRPRNPTGATMRRRSPSPARSTTSAMSTPSKTSPIAASPPPPTTAASTHRTDRMRKPPPALLADTSMDSFSDIDERLQALQQFLKDAKQGSSSGETKANARQGDQDAAAG